MSEFRLVALLPLAIAAGCYRAPPESTLPEPEYFSGPPGGAFDPGSSYSQYPGEPAYDEADERTAEGAPPSQNGPLAAPSIDPDDGSAPELSAPGDGDAVAEAPAYASPGDPTATVTDGEIEATLGGYGQWIETDDYGPVWRPDATVVGVDFTPYETGGSWAYTDAGWAFSCNYSWGWLPFHYGQWAWFNDYWGWVPGYQWSPAWVDWRHGGGVVGWRPMRPQIRDHRHGDSRRFGSGVLVRDHRRARQYDAHWRFAAASDLGRPHIRSHLYGNLAEGLRVTSTVSAPPVRARTTVPRADLMRNRFATSQPGRRLGGQVRDHRSADPRSYQPPAQGIRSPTRSDGYGPVRSAPPTRYQPPARPDEGPVRGAPPARTYDPSGRGAPPARTYYDPSGRGAPPARTYEGPVRGAPPARTYDPSGRGEPARTYQPPVRTYQPPARTYQPPVRTYQPPVRTYEPPVRTYTPPARTYAPPVQSAPPVRTYTPPARTYAPPARTYAPPVQSAPPARTYAPPAPSSSPPSRASSPPSSSGSSRSSSSSSGSHDAPRGRHR